MAPFDLDQSLERARRRFGGARDLPGRKQRSDRGRSRLHSEVLACVASAASGQEREPMRRMLRRIEECCLAGGQKPPSRATVYKLLLSLRGPEYRVGDLPKSVRGALYNLAPDSLVPGRQVAFYCFNYGDLKAMSFAAGLPWLALYQARRLTGYREKSRGLIEAAATARRTG